MPTFLLVEGFLCRHCFDTLLIWILGYCIGAGTAPLIDSKTNRFVDLAQIVRYTIVIWCAVHSIISDLRDTRKTLLLETFCSGVDFGLPLDWHWRTRQIAFQVGTFLNFLACFIRVLWITLIHLTFCSGVFLGTRTLCAFCRGAFGTLTQSQQTFCCGVHLRTRFNLTFCRGVVASTQCNQTFCCGVILRTRIFCAFCRGAFGNTTQLQQTFCCGVLLLTRSILTFCRGVVAATQYNQTFCCGVREQYIGTLATRIFCSGVQSTPCLQVGLSLLGITRRNWTFCCGVIGLWTYELLVDQFCKYYSAFQTRYNWTFCRGVIDSITGLTTGKWVPTATFFAVQVRSTVQTLCRLIFSAIFATGGLVLLWLHFIIDFNCYIFHFCERRILNTQLLLAYWALELQQYILTFHQWATLISWGTSFWYIRGDNSVGTNCKPGPKSRHNLCAARGFFRGWRFLLTISWIFCSLNFTGCRSEGCDLAMEITEAPEWISLLDNTAGAKQHGGQPPVCEGTNLRLETAGTIVKRSLRRACKRAAVQGMAWYRGRCYTVSDLKKMGCPESFFQDKMQQTGSSPGVQHDLLQCNRHHAPTKRLKCWTWNCGGLALPKYDEVASRTTTTAWTPT